MKLGLSQVEKHDWTKVSHIDRFVENLRAAKEVKFKTLKWWNIHVRKEKHHCLDYEGNEKLLLTDVLEMACDWIAAGKARSEDGSYDVTFHDKIEDSQLGEVLIGAFYNTLEYLNKNTTTDRVGPRFDQIQEPEVDSQSKFVDGRTL
jgi:hypothetical protein